MKIIQINNFNAKISIAPELETNLSSRTLGQVKIIQDWVENLKSQEIFKQTKEENIILNLQKENFICHLLRKFLFNKKATCNLELNLGNNKVLIHRTYSEDENGKLNIIIPANIKPKIKQLLTSQSYIN